MEPIIELPEAVVFDFDGTLVDSRKVKYETFFDITKHIPGARSFLEVLLEEKPWLDRYAVTRMAAREFFNSNIVDVVARKLADDYTAICGEHIVCAPEIPGATDLINTLREDAVPLFISSGTPVTLLKGIVEKRAWTRYFNDCFGSPDTKPTHLKSVQTLVGCPRINILMVGDSEIDQEAATSFGCLFAAIAGNCCSMRHADYNADNLIDLKTDLYSKNHDNRC